jgi:hypothetical protein
MSLQVWLCGSIRSFVLRVVLCGEACRHADMPLHTILRIWIFRCVRKIVKATISFVGSVHPSVLSSLRMEKTRSHWTDCREIMYLSIFWKSVQKIQVSLKSDKNNSYVTWRSIYSFIERRSVFLRMRNVRKKFVEKIKTHVLNSIAFLIEYRSCNEIRWKNVAEPNWLQMTIWRIRIACWIPQSTNDFRICNTYCFCTAKIYARTRLTLRHEYIVRLVIYLLQ